MDNKDTDDYKIMRGLGLTLPHASCATKDYKFAMLVKMMKNKDLTGQQITDYFHSIHSTTCEHSMGLKELFLCSAALNDRIDVFEHNQPLQQAPSPRCDPLMVAVRERNMPIIRLLIEAGYDPHESVHSGENFWNFGETRNRSSAMDYVLVHDDIDVLRKFPVSSYYHSYTLDQIRLNRPVKCFLHILQIDRHSRRLKQDDVYEAAIRFDVDVMEEMKKIGYDDFKRESWHVQRTTILHSAAMAILWNAQSRSHIEKLKYLLLQEEVTAYRFNHDREHPADLIIGELLSLDPHDKNRVGEYLNKYHTCVDATYVLLRAMRREWPKQELIMPRNTAMELSNQFYGMLGHKLKELEKQDSANPQRAHLRLSLDLCIDMLEMVLAAGVDLVNRKEEVLTAMSWNNFFGPKACNPSLFTYHRNNFLTMVGGLRRAHIKLFEEQIVNFNMLLLRYGMKPDSGCIPFLLVLLVTNIPRLTDGMIRPFISLMSAKDIHQLRELAANINETYQKTVINMSLISDKSLKESCRAVLYGCVKDRRMAVHVNSLPIKKQLKQWMCFDFEISEKNLELGMKTVKQQKRKAEDNLMGSSRNVKRQRCEVEEM